jgi:uncharacterized protein YbcI
MHDSFWSSFREEIVITSLLLGVMVISTFFLASLLFPSAEKDPVTSEDKSEEVAKQIDEAMALVLGEQTAENQSNLNTNTPNTTPSLTVTLAPTVVLTPLDTEIVFGSEGHYSFDDYTFAVTRPRIGFNAQDGNNKKFIADIRIKNNTLTQGLPMDIKAEVVKDGSIIVPQVVLSLTESKILMPGEEIVTQARLSLIDGTEVSKIFFSPLGAKEKVTHILQHNRDADEVE